MNAARLVAHPSPGQAPGAAPAWLLATPGAAVLAELQAAWPAQPPAAQAAPALVLVEPPHTGLAAALGANPSTDPAAWLAQWLEGARALLHAAQREPHRYVFIDVLEARAHPEALATLLGERFGLTGLPAWPAPPEASALNLTLALLATSAVAARSLLQGLRACCVPLGAEDAAPAPEEPPPPQALAGRAILAVQAEREAGVQHTERLQAQLAQAQAQAQALQADLQAARAQAQAAAEESELLLHQLHQVQEELEDQFRNRHAAEQARHELQQQVQALEPEAARLREEARQALHTREALQQAAAQSTQALEEAQRALEQARQELQAHTGQHEAEVARLQAELAQARQRVTDATEEADLILVQLHQVQEELEEQFRNRRAAEQARLELQQQVQALEPEAVRLREEARQALHTRESLQQAAAQSTQALEEAQRALEQARQELQAHTGQHEAEVARLQAELAQARQRVTDATEEADLILVQLHQVQEELEEHYLRRQRAEEDLARSQEATAQAEQRLQAQKAGAQRRAALQAQQLEQLKASAQRSAVALQRQRAARVALGQAVVRGIEVGAPAGTAPHLHLPVVLHGVRLGAATVAESRLRLVQHCGRPGLVLFGAEQGAHWLPGWQRTGAEAGRPFMALLPADSASAPLFEAMPGRDWLALLSVVEALQARLAEPGCEAGPLWLEVATRLRAQLLELAPRLRYDSLHIGPAPESPAAPRHITLGGVVYGARHLQTLALHLHLQPCAPGPTGSFSGHLVLLPGTSGLLPLFHAAPVQDGAEEAAPCVLPLGPGAQAAAQAQWWLALPAADRAFVWALLQALSGAAQGGPAGAELSAAERETLATAARQMARLSGAEPGPAGMMRRISRRMRAEPRAA